MTKPISPDKPEKTDPAVITRGKWTFTQKQIDAVVALIRDHDRVIAMGLGPMVIQAAMAAGWKPPGERDGLEKDRGDALDANR